MRCDMCGASQAKTKKIMYKGKHPMRACVDGGKVNVRTGEQMSCYSIYGA